MEIATILTPPIKVSKGAKIRNRYNQAFNALTILMHFNMFSIYAMYKTLILGRPHCRPQGHSLNKLSRSLLGDVTCKI